MVAPGIALTARLPFTALSRRVRESKVSLRDVFTVRLWPVVAIASVVILGLGVSSSWPTWLLALLAVAGAVGTYVAHARDVLEKTVVLFYEFDSDMEAAYGQLHNAASQLSNCAVAWHIEASGKVHVSRFESLGGRASRPTRRRGGKVM
jgi:hypothetical protein